MDNEDQKTNLPDESKKQELDKNVTKEENGTSENWKEQKTE